MYASAGNRTSDPLPWEINRTNYFDQYTRRCYHTCDNASMKLIMI